MGTDEDRVTTIAAEKIGVRLEEFLCRRHDCDEFVGGNTDNLGEQMRAIYTQR
jgi:hypothetical protein